MELCWLRHRLLHLQSPDAVSKRMQGHCHTVPIVLGLLAHPASTHTHTNLAAIRGGGASTNYTYASRLRAYPTNRHRTPAPNRPSRLIFRGKKLGKKGRGAGYQCALCRSLPLTDQPCLNGSLRTILFMVFNSDAFFR